MSEVRGAFYPAIRSRNALALSGFFPGVVEVARGDQPLLELAAPALVGLARGLEIAGGDRQQLDADFSDRPILALLRLGEHDHVATVAGRPDLVAEARTDRAGLFTALGRWAEAEQDLDIASGIFASIGDGLLRQQVWASLYEMVRDGALTSLRERRRR